MHLGDLRLLTAIGVFGYWLYTHQRYVAAYPLLAVYSLGLGVPFIATSLAINQFFAASARIRRHYHTIEVASGVLLVAVGLLIFTNRFTIIAQYLSPFLPTY